MRISDWSSDVCSSDLRGFAHLLDIGNDAPRARGDVAPGRGQHHLARRAFDQRHAQFLLQLADLGGERGLADEARRRGAAEVQVLGEGDEVLEVTQVHGFPPRSEEHTSELQSLMRISYAVFCLK